jgi:hypothetical protein
MALSVNGTESGASVVQNPSTTALNDNWSLVPTSNGYYHVIAQHTGLAMYANGTNQGANVVQRLASISAGDDWCFLPVGGNLYEIRNRLSARCVDVASFSKVAGSRLHMWTFVNGTNQKFAMQVAGNVTTTPAVSTAPWLTPVETPVLAASAAHLADGRILLWASKGRKLFGTEKDGVPSTETWTAIYNPTTGG